jgi:hypothetical protein
MKCVIRTFMLKTDFSFLEGVIVSIFLQSTRSSIKKVRNTDDVQTQDNNTIIEFAHKMKSGPPENGRSRLY